MTNIFLSHSSRDKDTAKRIALDVMMSNVGVWFDEWEIKVGHSITQKISRGLEDCDFIVVLLSKHSVESGWVEKEWATRISEEASSKKVFVLPIMIEDCEVPILLRDKRYADIRNNYSQGLRDLLDAIRFHATIDKPISAGAQIQSGRIVFNRTIPNIPIFKGLINTIEVGCFERSEEGLYANVKIVSSHQAIQDIAEKTGTNRILLSSSDYCVSVDPEKPSVFRCIQKFQFSRGEVIPNIISGKNVTLPFSLSCSSEIMVKASANNGVIEGNFTQYITYVPPVTISKLQVFGTFKAEIAF